MMLIHTNDADLTTNDAHTSGYIYGVMLIFTHDADTPPNVMLIHHPIYIYIYYVITLAIC